MKIKIRNYIQNNENYFSINEIVYTSVKRLKSNRAKIEGIIDISGKLPELLLANPDIAIQNIISGFYIAMNVEDYKKDIFAICKSKRVYVIRYLNNLGLNIKCQEVLYRII